MAGNEHNSNWYNNKQLYEMMQEVNKNLNIMDKRFIEYNYQIEKYNGLREDNIKQWEEIKKLGENVNSLESTPCKQTDLWNRILLQIDSLESTLNKKTTEKALKDKIKEAIYKWGGWIIAVLSYIHYQGWF